MDNKTLSRYREENTVYVVGLYYEVGDTYIFDGRSAIGVSGLIQLYGQGYGQLGK